MTAALAALLGTIGISSLLALVASLAHKAGAGKSAADALARLPAVDVKTSSATFNEAVDAAGNTVETIIKNALTGDTLQAFLAFLATGPSGASTLAWLEQNAGTSLVAQCEAALPALLKTELGILGGHIPSILGGLISKAAPDVAHDQATLQLASATVAKQLAAAPITNAGQAATALGKV